jgi:hypothetical protein
MKPLLIKALNIRLKIKKLKLFRYCYSGKCICGKRKLFFTWTCLDCFNRLNGSKEMQELDTAYNAQIKAVENYLEKVKR